jgi:adenosylcobinamide kinase/adenosylcobinamide-phosphate guanylyltransferase
MRTEVILVTGGCRSGKSSFAVNLVRDATSKLFVATAPITDGEMAERVTRHQLERGPLWRTIEEPTDIAGVLDRETRPGEPVVVDCLTTWVSNLILADESNAEKTVLGRLDELTASLRARKTRIVLVTNEVGSGVVPPYPLGRQFRDLAGIVNQRVGRIADRILLMVCGHAVHVKGTGEPIG